MPISPTRREGVHHETSRGVTADVWGYLRPLGIIESPGVGSMIDEPFTNIGQPTGSQLGGNGDGHWNQMGWWALYTNGGSVPRQVAKLHGGLILDTAATDTHKAFIASGGGAVGFAHLKEDDQSQVSFEARVEVTSAAIGNQSIAIGMADPSLGKEGNAIAAAGNAIANKNFVGFLAKTNASKISFDVIYKKGSEATVEVEEDVFEAEKDVPFHLGIVKRKYENKVRFFIRDVQVAEVALSATNFPKDDLLGVFAGTRTHAAAAKKFEIDWVRMAYARTD